LGINKVFYFSEIMLGMIYMFKTTFIF